jgi:ACS family pantothenate transporter-like MFS transporter
VSRLQNDGFEPPHGLNKTLWKRILGIWQYYAFMILLVIFQNIRYASSTPYLLWLKSQPERYSIPTINNLGTLTNAVAIISALTTSWYTDLRSKRWEPVIFAGVLSVFSNMVLAVWKIQNGLKFFAYTALGWVDGTSPILIAWMAEAFAGDLEARAVSLASFNCIAEITALVVPLIAWPVSKAPEFRGGFIWVSLGLFFRLGDC